MSNSEQEGKGGPGEDSRRDKDDGTPRIYALYQKGSKWGVSRREFVSGSAVVGAATSLVGCSPNPAQNNTPVAPVAPAGDFDEEVVPIAHSGNVSKTHAVTGGELLISAGEDLAIKIWKLPSGNLLKTLSGHTNTVSMLASSRKGTYLASAEPGGKVMLWSLPNGDLQGAVDCGVEIQEMYVSNDCSWLLVRHINQVQIWDVARKEKVRSVDLGVFTRHVFAENSKDLFSIVTRGWRTIEIISLINSMDPVVIRNAPPLLMRIDTSPGGNYLVAGTSDGMMLVYSLPDGTELCRHRDSTPFQRIKFRDEEIIDTLRGDKTQSYRLFHGGELIQTVDAHADVILDFALGESGRYAATVSKDRSIKIWNTASWVALGAIKNQPNSLFSVAILPGEQFFVVGEADGRMIVWPLDANAASRGGYDGHAQGVTRIQVDGQQLISCGKDDIVKEWEILDGGARLRLLQSFSGESARLFCVDGMGSTIASGSVEGVVRLSTRDGQLIKKLEGHQGPLFAVEIMRNTKLLASGGEDKEVRLWHMPSCELRHVLTGHTATVYSIDFHEEKMWLASSGKDGMVNIWNVESGISVLRIPSTTPLLDVRFLPEDRIAASGVDGKIRVWSLPKLVELQSSPASIDTDASEEETVIIYKYQIVIRRQERRIRVHTLRDGQQQTVMNDLVATKTEQERVQTERREKAIAEAKLAAEIKARAESSRSSTYSAPSYSYSPPSYSGHYWRPN